MNAPYQIVAEPKLPCGWRLAVRQNGEAVFATTGKGWRTAAEARSAAPLLGFYLFAYRDVPNEREG